MRFCLARLRQKKKQKKTKTNCVDLKKCAFPGVTSRKITVYLFIFSQILKLPVLPWQPCLRVIPAWWVQAKTHRRTFIMSTNIKNSASRKTLKRFLVLRVTGGGDPHSLVVMRWRRHIVLSQNALKKHSIFKQSLALQTHLLTCLLFST